MPKLHYEQYIDAPLAEVFEFHKNPYNLLKITPKSLNLTVANKEEVVMAKDVEILYRIRVGGVPLGWRSKITEYDPPKGFVDVQLSGPYKKWHHRHTFQEQGEGTLVIDDVDYEVPFGWLGRMVAGGLVARQLRGIFEHRKVVLDGVFGELRAASQ